MKTSMIISLLSFFLFGNSQEIQKSYFEDALKIILSFETNSMNIDDGYNKVTGNFDGNGISVGLLQWNIGQESLQKLVRNVGRETVLATMPQYGNNFWKACNSKKAEGLRIVRSWQVNNVVQINQKNEIENFLNSPVTKAKQYNEALEIGRAAYITSAKWAKDMRNADSCSFKEFVYFLDLLTLMEI